MIQSGRIGGRLCLQSLLAMFLILSAVGVSGCSARYDQIDRGDKVKIWYDGGEYVSLSYVTGVSNKSVSTNGVVASALGVRSVDIAINPYVKFAIIGGALVITNGMIPYAF